MSRAQLLGLAVFTAAAQPGAALQPLEEHLDLVPEFDAGSWDWEVVTDTDRFDPATVFLPTRDLDALSGDGERYERPAGSQWDFLGMDEGEPVWFLPQSDFGYTWPGFENGQSGLFASYVESDPRVGGLSLPWIRISLASVEGPGSFSLFQTQSGSTVVWMASSDGVGPDDVFFLASPGHDHMNWSFSAKGVYRIQFAAQAYLGPGATNPTPAGDPVAVFLSVGSRGEWRASHFPADEVMVEAIAGADADPDKDGRVNLVEYALGSDPNHSDPLNQETGEVAGPEFLVIEDGDSRYPALRFFRRIHEDADVSYSVEWSESLSGDWVTRGTEESVEDFGERWERVTIRDTQAVGGSRFGRLRVEATEP